MSKPNPFEKRSAPASAMRFDASIDVTAKPQADGKGSRVPVSMLARSPEPIDHWYWGVLVHDMAGMTLSKPVLPIDYCHDCEEVMGYADKTNASNEGLTMSGALVPFGDDDRVSEVLFKAGQGVPYEASINFAGDDTVIEYVPEGMSSPVNGYQFEGPGVIVRKWTLRGVSICPYGADQNTVTNLSDAGAADVKFKLTTPADAGKDTPMAGAVTTMTDPTKTDPAAPAAVVTPPATDTPAAGTATTPPTDAATLAAGKGSDKFITAFGDRGARLFCDGKSFEDATATYITELKTSHAAELSAKDATIATLNQRVDAVRELAGNDPLPARVGDATGKPADPKVTKLAQNLAPGTARFANSLKIPGATPGQAVAAKN